jgi:hypothetical protein
VARPPSSRTLRKISAPALISRRIDRSTWCFFSPSLGIRSAPAACSNRAAHNKKGPVAGAFVLHYRRPSRTLTGYFFFFGAAFFFAAAFLVAFFID